MHLFVVNPDKIKLDGEHLKDKDVSYNLWQKAKKNFAEDYETAKPLSEWKQSKINVDNEFSGLMQCTDTKVIHKLLATDIKYRERNRYTDILPFEHTRVKLQ